jgi:YgiT-type zinc finger domain-containing protein
MEAMKSKITAAATQKILFLPHAVKQMSRPDRMISTDMECLLCKGQLIRGFAPFSVDRNGYHIAWESIPAWACTQCGEAFFEENELNHIQKALQQVDHETLALKSRAA